MAFLARQGKVPKFDGRDRRFGIEEEMRIREVLADGPVELTFFILALETAMRMRECYTLDLSHVVILQETACSTLRKRWADTLLFTAT